MNIDLIVCQTRKWVQDVVVGLNFCPFARREVDRERIRYKVVTSHKRKDILECFVDECRTLDSQPEIETTLIIVPSGLADFAVYLDMLDMLEELLQLEGYEGSYQVASFHPDYCFADADLDDAANYTNRSPYPMFHLIREESLEKAIDAHPDADGIPETNIQRARNLGVDHMRQLLEQSKN